MKPPSFKYLAPGSLDEALELLHQHGDQAKLLAGGQSLIPTMNFRLARPAVLIDLNRIDRLNFVERGRRGRLRIGAMTRHRALEKSEVVAAESPLLHEAMPFVAHVQIRNRGTIGGSLAHADPAAELPAVTLALGARYQLQRRHGSRWVDANQFNTGMFMTALDPDEMITEIEIPAPEKRTGSAFIEIARRHGDYALVGVAAVLTLDRKGRIDSTRLVYLSVGEGPVVAAEARKILDGEVPGESLFAEAAETAATQDVDPGDDIHASAAYRRQLVRVLTRRALQTAAQRAAG